MSWRAWVGAIALAAVAWPATGPLPWVWAVSEMDLDLHGGTHAASGGLRDRHASEHAAAGHHHDLADIPGSPTHPADHDCAQCQVLKHLSRCVLSDPGVVGVAPLAGDPVRIGSEVEPQYASQPATRPPIRGPPLRRA